MDKLLRTSAREALAPPSSDCLDAERLAAWSEGVLPATEAARAEAHLADCSRCQAMLAVFGRSQTASATTAAAGGAVVPFRPRLSARWLMPIAAVAAVLLVWIALPDSDSTSTVPAQTTARLEPSPAAQLSDLDAAATDPGTGAARATSAAQTAPPAVAAAREGLARREPPPAADVVNAAPAKSAAPAPTPAPAPAPAEPVLPTAPTIPPRAQTLPLPAAQAAPPPPPATADAAAATVGEARTFVRLEQAPLDLLARPILIVSADARPVGQMAESVSVQSSAGRGGRGGRNTAAAAAPPPPAPTATIWRIVPLGGVDRSTDGGVSWQPLNVDRTLQLTGGASPSASVCWLIGRGGVVLRSIDGLRFESVPFPEPIDLTTIHSTGALQATIAAADGRVFTTTDGGASWRTVGQ